METDHKSDIKNKPPSRAFWLQVLVGGLVGFFGYRFVDTYVDPRRDGLSLGDELALVFGGLWVFVCLFQAVLFILTYCVPKIGDKFGISQMLGGAKRGRMSLWPMTIYYVALGVLTMLLTLATIGSVTKPMAVFGLAAGTVCVGLMVWSGQRLWQVLDELLKVIWVEALALTGLLCLIFGALLTLANLLGFIGSVSGFQGFILFNYIYLFVYCVILMKRAPEMFTSPTLDDA